MAPNITQSQIEVILTSLVKIVSEDPDEKMVLAKEEASRIPTMLGRREGEVGQVVKKETLFIHHRRRSIVV